MEASDGTISIETKFTVNVTEVQEDVVTTEDTDSDGIPDWWEMHYGLDPEDPSDASGDPDGDGITNLEEYERGTSPTTDDSDKGSEGTDPWLLIMIVVLSALTILFLVLFIMKRRESEGVIPRE